MGYQRTGKGCGLLLGRHAAQKSLKSGSFPSKGIAASLKDLREPVGAWLAVGLARVTTAGVVRRVETFAVLRRRKSVAAASRLPCLCEASRSN